MYILRNKSKEAQCYENIAASSIPEILAELAVLDSEHNLKWDMNEEGTLVSKTSKETYLIELIPEVA